MGVFSVALTHDLGGRRRSHDDGHVGGDEGHPGFDVFVDLVFGLVQLQGHVTGLLQFLQFVVAKHGPTSRHNRMSFDANKTVFDLKCPPTNACRCWCMTFNRTGRMER